LNQDHSQTATPIAEPVSTSSSEKKVAVLIYVLLAASVVAVYWPTSRYEFIHCDDPDYIITNPQVQAGLTWQSIAWAFTTDHANNWHPLTWLSHMLDCQLFGLRAGWHHVTNAAFHLANTLLLFALLRRLTGATYRSAFVAVLFALHPLHVESVAWVAERKDVLSTFFFMLTLIAYAKYVSNLNLNHNLNPAPPRSHAPRYYVLSLLLFALGLMSKPMLVTLPFVLLLLDFWPLRRLRVGELRVEDSGSESVAQGSTFNVQRSKFLPLPAEKIPFFALSAASCVVTFLVQRHEGNVATVNALPIELRIENALLSYVVYIKNMFWPTRLAAYYPYPKDIPLEAVAGAAALLLAVSIWALVSVRRRPYVLVGWLWYLGTLIPVIGLVQAGLQARADRYTYIPLIGLFIVIAWVTSDLANRWRMGRIMLPVGSAAVLIACAIATRFQLNLWSNTETLFSHALAVTANNAHAHQNLGAALAQKGKLDAAAEHFIAAVTLMPNYAEAQSNLGFALAANGKNEEAIVHYRAALALKPSLPQTHFLLANALSAQGNRDEARTEYETAIQLKPDHPLALNDLAWMLATDPDPARRNGEQAVQLAERACRITGYDEALLLGTLAAAYAEAGRFEDAVKTAEKAAALADKDGQTELAKKNRELMELYRTGKAYHEKDTQLPTSNSSRDK
jgi:Flp pilus assembly protein TadD